ncbi:unnamed protein product [Pleuronectes platessa]|uniref:Uncharacterized protein n=1 Tax=Pleuronectes platessa TaxID=8262 RepID=A0A9N7Y9V4_PLEPL|nr:unnamed protein product [Pleuronectes platessa]
MVSPQTPTLHETQLEPILPVPLHYATSFITTHSEEFGESSEPPPSCCQAPLPLHAVGAVICSCHPRLEHHLWLHRCPMRAKCCSRAYLRLCVNTDPCAHLHTCPHPSSSPSVSITISMAVRGHRMTALLYFSYRITSDYTEWSPAGRRHELPHTPVHLFPVLSRPVLSPGLLTLSAACTLRQGLPCGYFIRWSFYNPFDKSTLSLLPFRRIDWSGNT